MENELVEIELYDKKNSFSYTMYVEQLAENTFRMIDNAIFFTKLTIGTEFEARVNENGAHEFIKIIKDSNFIRSSFLLSPKNNLRDYRQLLEVLNNRGGHWEVTMAGVLILAIPKGFETEIRAVVKEIGLDAQELDKDDL